MTAKRATIRILTLCLLLALCVSAAATPASLAQEPAQKVVRVGWFDSSFCYWDQFGRRCGVDYEYQQKISAYTGWTYEYVEDSWSNLLQMLIDGEIDLLSDVSYKPERAQYMSFPDLPMGSEAYYVYVNADEREITADRPSSFNGKRIGVNKDSIQEGFLRDWAERNELSIEIILLDVSEADSLAMLARHEIDGFATIYSSGSETGIVPISRIGASEYFYAVNKNRPDLLAELNMALSGIQDEDPDFQQRVRGENNYYTNTDIFLTPAQEDWLRAHGAIRVGYRDDSLPFCQADNGELTGALKDYLAHAANNLRSYNIEFEAIPFASTVAALDAMKAGEIDCVFPINLSTYDAAEADVRLTGPAMKTEMNALMRASDRHSISRDSRITFAVSADDPNIETFIMAKYPASVRKTYADTQACFNAVTSGDAACILVSNYRMPSAQAILEKNKLLSVPTGESMPLSFAVNAADRELYFIMNKTVTMTNPDDMDAALASYMHADQHVSFTQFLRDNWINVVAAVSLVFLLIIFLLTRSLRAERRANERQRMMEEGLRRELRQKEQLQSAMEMAYRDPLTGVKSKHAYNEAEALMDSRIAAGEVSRFSIVVFDLNDLKLINDSRGHEIGDEYIKDACKQICACFKRSPVFRVGGDEFTAILEGEDYDEQDELLEKFEKQILVNMQQGGAVIAFGCARFEPRRDKRTREVFDRADAAMYKEKLLLKSFGEENGHAPAHRAESAADSDDLSVLTVRRHILIADDIESNREILGDLLREDYDILYACDGSEALDILRSRRDEIALVILDLYMPNMTGREVMAHMQVDEELMAVPVIVLTVDQEAELECLRMGAMDFIPKPYPDIDIVKARIAKCIELSENRSLIRSTQHDKLTGLYNIEYFLRYVNRYDQHYVGLAFDAFACDINRFYSVNERYGRQFGDLVLRSIGIGMNKLARRTGGIACRKGGDVFLLYCPHQEDYKQLIRKFTEDLFVEKDTASRVNLRFGVYENAQQETDIEERFERAILAADSVKDRPDAVCGFYGQEAP